MEPTKTVDELIAKLQKFREEAGGDCRVMLRVYGRELLHAYVSLGATGKGDPHRTVSRSGNPCVIIGE
jgi:hypothetical protein